MLVCVTGATGFVASALVRELLERGYRVRGTVRDPAKAKLLEALPGAAERLELARADLMDRASLEAAVRGTDVVLHTASPYVLTVKDPQRDLVEPALEGTRNALAACHAAGGIRRVVLTSSVAALSDEGGALDERSWNTTSSLERNPYYYSKTVAERAAWDFVEQKRPGYSLVVINPGLVIGPSLIPAINASATVIADLLNGKQPAIARLDWGVVDVRDVARAHVLAMEKPDASGRYVCVAETVDMRTMVEILRRNGLGKGRLPKLSLASPLGDAMVRLFSHTMPKGSAQYVRTNVGKTSRFDHGKIERELGLHFRGVEETIVDTARDLAKWGHVR